MATLTVWKFSTADGAENALAKLRGLQKEHLVGITDAALVSWPAGKNDRIESLQGAGSSAAGAFRDSGVAPASGVGRVESDGAKYPRPHPDADAVNLSRHSAMDWRNPGTWT